MRVDSQRAFFYFLGAEPMPVRRREQLDFSQLVLTKTLRRAIADIGYDSPTPIQTKALPPALAGRDVLGCAQTGTGKTAAFALPVLQQKSAERKLRRENAKKYDALITQALGGETHA